LPNQLKILLADAAAERAAALEARLRELGDAVIVRLRPAESLIEAVAAAAPDVIIVDMARPDRDALDDLRRVSAGNPRPIVMFVDRDDRPFMEAAIAAGVSSYNIASAPFPDVKPIVMAAVAIFRRHQELAAALERAQAALREREAITRAKSLLMRRHRIGEPEAYRRLRRTAMNQNRRIAAVAADLVAAAPKEETKE
jgi:two-component system, response regulator / RNA-binding antiterminator